MLELPGVTLCCIDTANRALALRALLRSKSSIGFGRNLFLTAAPPPTGAIAAGSEIALIPTLRSHADYSQFVLKELAQYITTPHVLLIQWDGFVVNPEAWDASFLDCDYLGAKWFWHGDGMQVGNGGFSLRSKHLLDALQDPRITLQGAEDETIGRSFRPLLEREHGIRFGSEDLADRFSFEAAYPIGEPFGFHGLFNFCRTVPQDEIVAMAPEFSDAILRSPQLEQLLRNCAAMGQWHAVAAIAARVLGITPNAIEARDLLERARTAIAQPNVGRNAPCPCGSGRKFKQCHGAIATPSAAHHEALSTTPANNVLLPLPTQRPGPPTRAITTAMPSSADQLVERALAAHQQHQLDAAEQDYRSALAQSPEHAIATHYLGVILYQRNRVDEALPLLQRAATAIPHEPEFHNNLGLALASVDRNDEAIAAYHRALANNPAHTTAWNNLGLVLQASNRLDEAIAAFREAVRLQPDFGQAHWNLALALLCAGEFEEGWREYAWRLDLPELGLREVLAPARRWNGIAAPGKTLLLTAEQGLGDALQFARFAQPLAALGMRVLIRAPVALQHLLATVPGVSAVHKTEAPLPDHDAHLPLLSVPGMLRIRSDTIPGNTPYLAADPARRMALRKRLLSLSDRQRNIGVCWAGNPQHGNDRRRSLSIAALSPLLEMEDVRWFSLQRNSAAGPPLIEWTARNDFDDLAALIAELDLVVTVDTSIAHLAGALGRPTWVLLPFAPDWRWGPHREDSSWYPTMRLFRQRATGDWSTVIEDVRVALQG